MNKTFQPQDENDSDSSNSLAEVCTIANLRDYKHQKESSSPLVISNPSATELDNNSTRRWIEHPLDVIKEEGAVGPDIVQQGDLIEIKDKGVKHKNVNEMYELHKEPYKVMTASEF